MMKTVAPANAYTDSPGVHSNLVLGSLQLLCWLFFHPSAWRNYLARVDPTLQPNFGLTELRREQWQNPNVRRLLVMGHVTLPGLAGVLVALGSWLVGAPIQAVALSVAIGILLGIGVGMISSLIVGTPVSIVLGPAIGIGGGIGAGVWLALGIGGGVGRATGTAVDVVIEALIFGVAFGIVFGISGGLIGGLAGSLAGGVQSYSPTRQFGGIVVGIMLGSVVLFAGGLSLIGEINLPMITVVASLLVGFTVGWGRDPVAGIIVAAAVALGLYIASALPGTSTLGTMLFGALTLPVYIIAERIAGPLPGAIGSALGGGSGWIASTIMANSLPFWPLLPLSMIGILLGLTVFWWRPLLMYPFEAAWNTLLRHVDERRQAGLPAFLRWHAAFWDEHQRLRLFGLDEHILLIMERTPGEGRAAIEYLSTSRQRWAAQAVQIELEARWLASCETVEVMASVHHSLATGELTGPASALLRSFSRLSQDVTAALQQGSAYNQRLALSTIEDRLDGLLRELTRSSEPYAIRFRPIATSWRKIVAARVRKLAETIELRQEIDNPYVVGVPLTEQQEIFVGRTDISTRIEQLLLDRRRPPLLLYGQRRMGKTSLLNNLGRLLPSTIVPLFIDLQGPASQASDHAGFFYNVARGMVTSAQRQRGLALPRLPREKLTVDPFTYFDEWLDEVEQVLQQHTALVTLDEFEALDSAIAKGNLDGIALLNMMRHLIQHRSRFKILLTSSQALEEFQRWSSYMINIQVVHISYLSQVEARQLIERPVKNFGLKYDVGASRRVLQLTRGHPFLVQLLCGEIIAHKNEQNPTVRRLARLEDVEAVISEVMQRGSFFFSDIERNQVDANGLNLLRFLAACGEGTVVERRALSHQLAQPGDLDQTLTGLIRRELLEAVNGGYRFQVELIRRWFAK